jgi:hypothetical protein
MKIWRRNCSRNRIVRGRDNPVTDSDQIGLVTSPEESQVVEKEIVGLPEQKQQPALRSEG